MQVTSRNIYIKSFSDKYMQSFFQSKQYAAVTRQTRGYTTYIRNGVLMLEGVNPFICKNRKLRHALHPLLKLVSWEL